MVALGSSLRSQVGGRSLRCLVATRLQLQPLAGFPESCFGLPAAIGLLFTAPTLCGQDRCGIHGSSSAPVRTKFFGGAREYCNTHLKMKSRKSKAAVAMCSSLDRLDTVARQMAKREEKLAAAVPVC